MTALADWDLVWAVPLGAVVVWGIVDGLIRRRRARRLLSKKAGESPKDW